MVLMNRERHRRIRLSGQADVKKYQQETTKGRTILQRDIQVSLYYSV